MNAKDYQNCKIREYDNQISKAINGYNEFETINQHNFCRKISITGLVGLIFSFLLVNSHLSQIIDSFQESECQINNCQIFPSQRNSEYPVRYSIYLDLTVRDKKYNNILFCSNQQKCSVDEIKQSLGDHIICYSDGKDLVFDKYQINLKRNIIIIVFLLAVLVLSILICFIFGSTSREEIINKIKKKKTDYITLVNGQIC